MGSLAKHLIVSITMFFLLQQFGRNSEVDAFTTVEVELETCRKELKDLSSGHFSELNKLITDASKLDEQLELQSSSRLNNRKDWEAKISQKRGQIQTLKRTNAQKDTNLALKFDCKASPFTIKQCRSYCTFPYSYDSCKSTSDQLKFVQRLEAAEGKCYHFSYDSSSSQKCNQIHVVV